MSKEAKAPQAPQAAKDAVQLVGEPHVSPTTLPLDEATALELRRLHQGLNASVAALGGITYEKSLLQEREEAATLAVKRANEELARTMEQTLRRIGAQQDPSAQWTFQLERMPPVVERVR